MRERDGEVEEKRREGKFKVMIGDSRRVGEKRKLNKYLICLILLICYDGQ